MLRTLSLVFVFNPFWGGMLQGMPSPLPPASKVSLKAYMDAVGELGHFSGVVLVARDGRALFRGAYGMANLDQSIPNRPDTQFHIASLTKSFTAAAILRLAEQGKLKLDDQLAAHFAETPKSWPPITLRHLLQHSSGLPDYENLLGGIRSDRYRSLRSQPDHLIKLRAMAFASELEFEPGAKFSYSNTGYLLLGYLVEQLSGQSFGDFVRQQFLEPLGLRASGQAHFSKPLAKLALSYRLKPDRQYAEVLRGFKPDSGMLVPAPAMRMETPNGAGGMYATADDLRTWIDALVYGSALKDDQRKAMFTPGEATYGLGWFIQTEDKRKSIFHTGSLPGYRSILATYPEERVTVVLVGNTDQRLGQISRDLAAIVFGEAVIVPRAHHIIEAEPNQFRHLFGKYQREDGRIYEVTADEEMVLIQETDRFIAGMLPESEDSFFVPMFRGNVTFLLDQAGNPTQLRAQVHGKEYLLKKME